MDCKMNNYFDVYRWEQKDKKDVHQIRNCGMKRMGLRSKKTTTSQKEPKKITLTMENKKTYADDRNNNNPRPQCGSVETSTGATC